jgi:hypothetical protein
MNKYYEVIEEGEFTKQIDELEKRFSRVSEIKGMLSFNLFQNPYVWGEKIPGKSGYYVLRTDEPMDIQVPYLEILYKIDDEDSKVYLIALREITEDDKLKLTK